ncbi:MAG: hypothetical protein JSR60_20520 [Proteobacteria bacterium]|nr:hypothetical protein [Pseudomonadota bacterium]
MFWDGYPELPVGLKPVGAPVDASPDRQSYLHLDGKCDGVYYIHADQLNRPQKISDGSAAVVWDGVFDRFGNPTSVTGTVAMPLRFPGQYADPETALNQNWFRDYDPSIGRYVESDPIGLMGGLNTYGYVEGNPITSVDSLGLFDPGPWNFAKKLAIGEEIAGGGPEDPVSTGAAITESDKW